MTDRGTLPVSMRVTVPLPSVRQRGRVGDRIPAVPTRSTTRPASSKLVDGVTATVDWSKVFDEPNLKFWDESTNSFVQSVKATAGGGAGFWPVWPRFVTRTQRRRGRRPRPLTAGRHSRDLFYHDEKLNRRTGRIYIAVKNKAPYARALEAGAAYGYSEDQRPLGEHGGRWRRPKKLYLRKFYRRIAKPSEQSIARLGKAVERATKREAREARRLAKQYGNP